MEIKHTTMRKIYKIVVIGVLLFTKGYGGNPERTGQAGATQLMINPYAYSSGFNSLNVSRVYGVEGFAINPAGIAGKPGAAFQFSHTKWLLGSDININALGFTYRWESGSALGFALTAFDVGEIERTTIYNTDGELGTFSPTIMNFALGYGHTFIDDRIFVGIVSRVINESVSDASAVGVSFDGGVIYRSDNQKFRVGVALRNVGPNMRFKGEGLTHRVDLGSGLGAQLFAIPSASTELPAQLYIGASYDFLLNEIHRITPLFGFISNSFARDNYGLGLEYGYKNWLAIRGAYTYEDKLFNEAERMTVLSGLSAGLSLNIPLSKASESPRERLIGVDYSYRSTYIFQGVHSFGLRVEF